VAAELSGIAARGAVAGLCPITEANLGDGVFDICPFRAAGGRFGVGTDSNVLIDAAGELRQLEYAQRLTARRRNVLASDAHTSTGRTLFAAALAGGAQALGVAAGGLAVGQPADIVSLAADHPALIARDGDSLLDGWVFAARTGAVDAVWVRGRQVVAGGRHFARDLVDRRFRVTLEKFRA
jgi:cytosine/adenosine deaminase-related metal-dependent hydrolase